MAKITQLPRLKQLRSRYDLTTADVAEVIGLSLARAGELDNSLASATVAELRDLAVLFNESVDGIRGVETPWEELAASPFAKVANTSVPYGTLRLVFRTHRVEYPIDERNRDGILKQLGEKDVQERDMGPSWLLTGSLDNKVIFANLHHLVSADLIGDDVEAMPSYEHPEVYAAVERSFTKDESFDVEGPLVRSKVMRLCELQGAEAAIRRANYVRMMSHGGGESWELVEGAEDTLGLFTLELEAYGEILPNRFIVIRSEGWHRQLFVNLTHVELIEAPANRYARTNSDSA